MGLFKRIKFFLFEEGKEVDEEIKVGQVWITGRSLRIEITGIGDNYLDYIYCDTRVCEYSHRLDTFRSVFTLVK